MREWAKTKLEEVSMELTNWNREAESGETKPSNCETTLAPCIYYARAHVQILVRIRNTIAHPRGRVKAHVPAAYSRRRLELLKLLALRTRR